MWADMPAAGVRGTPHVCGPLTGAPLWQVCVWCVNRISVPNERGRLSCTWLLLPKGEEMARWLHQGAPLCS